MFASLGVSGFVPVYLCGYVFGMARWGLGFLAAYVANDLTGSPRAVQLTGAAMWLPMLFAGVLAGVLADRWDRRFLLIGAIGTLLPVSIALGLLEGSDMLQVWMLYPAMLVLGMSWVTDITARRTLVLDIVGPRLIDNAMALEALSTAIALALGVLIGGAVIERLGVGQAFFAVAGLLALAAVALSQAPSKAKLNADAADQRAHDDRAIGAADGEQSLETVDVSVRAALANPRLRSVLGITVLANFFYFSHTPLVPVFAEALGVGALGAGFLASANGLGMMIAAIAVAALRPPRGITYVLGAGIALTLVVGLAQANIFLVGFGAALGAATGFGLFGATQAVSTMMSVEPELRGRAMGLLSMAIGALPIGMFTLGELAEWIGPSSAVTVYATTGVVGLGLWLVRRREVLGLGR